MIAVNVFNLSSASLYFLLVSKSLLRASKILLSISSTLISDSVFSVGITVSVFILSICVSVAVFSSVCVSIVVSVACFCNSLILRSNSVFSVIKFVLSFSNVVKTTVFLDNMDDFTTVNGIYAEYFVEPYPARSAVEVAKLPKGALIEVEVIAKK